MNTRAIGVMALACLLVPAGAMAGNEAAEAFEFVAHGRVYPAVGTGDSVTRGFGQGGNTTHEGPADTEDMDVHISPR